MKKRIPLALLMALVVLLAGGFYVYRTGGVQSFFFRRNDLLARMPADAAAVLFLDLEALRATPLLALLSAWAPTREADPHYAQFQKDTGFAFARDLARLAVAWKKTAQQDPLLLALAEGNFDQSRISTFARKTGTVRNSGKHELFSVPLGGSANSFSFTFLRADRVALTNGSALASFLEVPKRDAETAAWRVRFERLSGSPLLAVIRKDARIGEALARQAPGGLRSPELSSLLDQLEWISIAGKPENDGLRVTAEGEASGETTTRELADLLRGMLVLAEAGLNDANTRRQLPPAARAAYLEVVKNAQVETLDRGDLKAVRLSIRITPAFLESAAPRGGHS